MMVTLGCRELAEALNPVLGEKHHIDGSHRIHQEVGNQWDVSGNSSGRNASRIGNIALYHLVFGRTSNLPIQLEHYDSREFEE